jgi:hypothetical protein
MVELEGEEEVVEAGHFRDQTAKKEAHMYHPYVI